MKKELWKWAQDEVQAALTHRAAKDSGFAWHRYPDARSARGALAAQPADFLVAYMGRGIHIEVKSTQQKHRLPRGEIGQWGKLRLFDLAGFKTIIMVYRAAFGDWVWLDRHDLFTAEALLLKSYPWPPNRGARDMAASALSVALSEQLKG